jgi:translation initiation factor IF-3
LEGSVILTPKKEIRVNARIRSPEVRVIGADGSQVGILPIRDALRLAEEQALDLVEVAPLAKPPVCKIIDYGKFKYEQKKKATDARKNQVVVQVKEVKMRPKTDTHDFDFKANHARRFLEEGDKVKASIVFRGREMAHQEIGLEHLNRLAERLSDVGIIEQPPRMEGRAMGMLIAPKPKV